MSNLEGRVRDGNVNACFHPDDDPVELRNGNGNVNACFRPDDGDVDLGLTGVEERHLAALAVR